MAKQKPNKKSSESGDDRHKSPSTPFRPDDPRLLEALKAFAKSIRRSRNMAMNLLLEEILKEKGFWPWPRAEEPSEEA